MTQRMEKKGVGSPINPFNLSALFLAKLKTIKKGATKDNDINILRLQSLIVSPVTLSAVKKQNKEKSQLLHLAFTLDVLKQAQRF